jgi:hypothetical protein
MAKKKTAKKKVSGAKKSVETITHADDKRSNIPTAEMASVVSKADKAPVKLRYPRNTDLDPQLVWKGKDEQDESDLGLEQVTSENVFRKKHPKPFAGTRIECCHDINTATHERISSETFSKCTAAGEGAKASHEKCSAENRCSGESCSTAYQTPSRSSGRTDVSSSQHSV